MSEIATTLESVVCSPFHVKIFVLFSSLLIVRFETGANCEIDLLLLEDDVWLLACSFTKIFIIGSPRFIFTVCVGKYKIYFTSLNE
jgi:hypothetical protein